MCKTLLLIFFVNVFVLNCRAGMQTENPYIDPANPSFSGNITVGGTVDGVDVSALGQSTGTFMIKESTYSIYATSVMFPDGTVQVSSPSSGGWVGTATSDLTMGGYDLMGGGTVQATTRLETNRIIPYSGNVIRMFNALNKGFGMFSNTTVSEVDCLAIMPYSNSSGADSIAMMRDSGASGSDSLSAGYGTQVSGEQAVGLGAFAGANGYRATAVGEQARADGLKSTAIGKEVVVSGIESVALGRGFTNAIASSCIIGYVSRNILILQNTTYIYTGLYPDFTYQTQINLGDLSSPFDILYIETITYCSLNGYIPEKSISEDFAKLIDSTRARDKKLLPKTIYVPAGKDKITIQRMAISEINKDTDKVKFRIIKKYPGQQIFKTLGSTGEKILFSDIPESADVEVTQKSKEGQNLNAIISLLIEHNKMLEDRIKVLEAKIEKGR